MKLSLFSIIGGTFYKFSDVQITEETLKQFEEEVGSEVTKKLSSIAPLLPALIKITPELVVSEEHNGDVMVKDIILETKELATASAASVIMMAGDDAKMPEPAEGCYRCKERNTLLQHAVDTWGRFAQVDMMIEEMSELTKALLKERRAAPVPVSDLENAIANIREEMADVQIMLDQMKLIYGNPESIETEKLDRLAERLGKEDDNA